MLNENGFMVIIVSNQAGIAHGYYQEKATMQFNQAMRKKLAEGDIECGFIADNLYAAAVYILDATPDTETRSKVSERRTG